LTEKNIWVLLNLDHTTLVAMVSALFCYRQILLPLYYNLTEMSTDLSQHAPYTTRVHLLLYEVSSKATFLSLFTSEPIKLISNTSVVSNVEHKIRLS